MQAHVALSARSAKTLRRTGAALIEQLEGRAMLSAGPTIASLDGSAPLTRKANLTLTAQGVSPTDSKLGDVVSRVDFYVDADKDGVLNTSVDPLVGSDTDGAGGWSLTTAATDIPAGSTRFFARAAMAVSQNGTDQTLYSDPVSTTLAIPNRAPVIDSLIAPPGTLNKGEVITIMALASDDSAVDRVEFYRDVNGDGILQTNIDQLLATDASAVNGWSFSIPATQSGSAFYFARAADRDGVWSEPASAAVAVRGQPVSVDAFFVNPTEVFSNQPLNLHADVSGSAVKVEFYRDYNNNGAFDRGTDRLLGTGVQSTDGWDWTGSASAFPTGSSFAFARALDDQGRAVVKRVLLEVMPVSQPAPTVTFKMPVVRATAFSFTVVYKDIRPITLSSIKSAVIELIGPRGYRQTATLMSVTPAKNASTITAVYKVSVAPGTDTVNIWDPTDNGSYAINMVSGRIVNSAGFALTPRRLSQFRLNLPVRKSQWT